MDISSLLKYERRHKGLYNFLDSNLNEIKKADALTYSHRAKFFDVKNALNMERPEFTKPLRSMGKKRVFLELACGSAAHGLNMSKDGYKVIETDIAEGTIRKVKEFSEKFALDNITAVADAENLPFKNESIDGIFMIASLHHMQNPRKALSEIHRCLRSKGKFLIGYEPAAWQYYLLWPFMKLARAIIRKRNPGLPISIADDVTFGFSKRHLRKLLESAGFTRVKITPVYYTYKTYKNYRILISKLCKKPLHEHQGLKRVLRQIDKRIARIPLVKNLTWDWDCISSKD